MVKFRQIYNKYKHQVYFFIKKYIDQDSDAEDVVQEVFVHLWKHRSSFNSTKISEEALVFKTAKQEIANFYRKNKTLHHNLEHCKLEKIQEIEEEYDESFITEHLNKILLLIEKLPNKTKDIFLRNKIENISYSALAKEHKISKSAVEKHVQRAIKFIRANLREQI
ncbi:RNA polymerase sigma factor [Riemerella anatipestifer]|uniref:Sigma-70 family RNA polymerase sigma factor n=1 Tax=Riemerella anatipestifer TaxID=34085 RepID=A0AAP6LKC8_RIEAN|nr:sigma-70 family RNA polymerase sigma factor [Riemerella anatipestifer]MBT0536076.1 sigma-70 family RNA polymerase sigma factor [Riemerella anatipestifer]MBT0550101.1 sigma-70 family RNA polymerase sigma factor [Riemerella anatipestifer]MBT0556920.1 sigma-70 family RNA polymerase sigma factor [Riemerella anatipestifer]MBT0560861.1 sigma-70 family RNA polymerase sigma factor [Riemerella anatipestifer]MBT0564483.1 sigma-70 family RNA polymerase sigma factor [Riemerella anatipestifer]